MAPSLEVVDPRFAGYRFRAQNNTADNIEEGGKPYTIPAAAYDHELGGMGFANWAYELKAQE